MPAGEDFLLRKVRDLERKMTEGFAAASGSFTVTRALATFNTGVLPDDNTFHNYGASLPLIVDVATTTIVVTIGCSQAMTTTAGAAVSAEATFAISDGSVVDGDVYANTFVEAATAISAAPLCLTRAFVVAPGMITVTGQMRAKASGSAAGSVNFYLPYLTVQVTG